MTAEQNDQRFVGLAARRGAGLRRFRLRMALAIARSRFAGRGLHASRFQFVPPHFHLADPSIAYDFLAGQIVLAGRSLLSGARIPFDLPPPSRDFAIALHGFEWLRHFEASGHPTNLTMLHPIAAGDMYGVKGIDHIAKNAQDAQDYSRRSDEVAAEGGRIVLADIVEAGAERRAGAIASAARASGGAGSGPNSRGSALTAIASAASKPGSLHRWQDEAAPEAGKPLQPPMSAAHRDGVAAHLSLPAYDARHRRAMRS